METIRQAREQETDETSKKGSLPVIARLYKTKPDFLFSLQPDYKRSSVKQSDVTKYFSEQLSS
ncbi:hypothetical protein [Acetobacter senegalensis]|uniref:hypothetical protein n=1 Tax=Acetobacter senegalensis TaxID=446692 RepID=UPI001EDABDF9|nr:hypothetical protein [Acetobacter senegalensis]MCG4272476.1 hypothetical protein [Acetobacter senegalensis]